MSLLGLDVGTTGTKAVAFADDGAILGQAYRDYPLIHPRVDWVELDANLLWERVSEAVAEVNSMVENSPVEAVSVSSQGEAVVPLDGSGRPLYNFIVTFDNRTVGQLEWWKENVGAETIYRETGMPVHSMYTVNKCMWFAESLPELHRTVWKYLCVEDYVIYRLCGEPAIDYSLAARTMAFDVRALKWSELIFGKAGLDQELFASVYPSGTVIGNVSTDIAEELGFAVPAAVVTGGHDQACGALGAGVIRSGMAANSTGTVDVLCPALDRCILDDTMLDGNFCCYPHAYPGMYITVAFNLTGGLLLKWYRDVLCRYEVEEARRAGINVYDAIIRSAREDPASVFVLPHFVGAGTPTLDPRSRGAIVGLTIATDKPELTRAILDSVNYEMYHNIQRIEDCGILVEELRAVGGGARSARWLQMKANVFGKAVSAPAVSEAAALGAAILAGTALGCYGSIDEAVARTVKTAETYEPDPDEHERYRARYEAYARIYPALKELNETIAGWSTNL